MLVLRGQGEIMEHIHFGPQRTNGFLPVYLDTSMIYMSRKSTEEKEQEGLFLGLLLKGT